MTEVKASGNTFGNYFQVATYGESHGGGVGCVISGCPPRIPLTEADLQVELDRRCTYLFQISSFSSCKAGSIYGFKMIFPSANNFFLNMSGTRCFVPQ
jgi:hypothetical protein